MMPIATMRLKLTSTAATLTVARRAVPRSCATAICRHAGPCSGRRANAQPASVGALNTAASRKQAIAVYPGRAMPSSAGSASAARPASASTSATSR